MRVYGRLWFSSYNRLKCAIIPPVLVILEVGMILSSRFEEALLFATRLHSTQWRKGTGIPYIAHLLAVTSIVLENGGNEDEAIAALLHDAIEDQGGDATREEIRRRFGNDGGAIVDASTDPHLIPNPPSNPPTEPYTP